jgi:hypothetical protein
MIKERRDIDHNNMDRIKKGMVKNNKVPPFLVSLMTDQIALPLSPIALLQLKTSIYKIIIKMIKKNDFNSEF